MCSSDLAWQIQENNIFIFAFEFELSDYGNGFYGIIRTNEKIDVIKTVGDFKEDIEKLIFKAGFKQDGWWLGLKYVSRDKGDFIEYILNGETNPEKLANEIFDFINKVETENKLLTKINTYLKNP